MNAVSGTVRGGRHAVGGMTPTVGSLPGDPDDMVGDVGRVRVALARGEDLGSAIGAGARQAGRMA